MRILYYKEYDVFNLNEIFSNLLNNKELDFLVNCNVLKITSLNMGYFNFVGMLTINNNLIIIFPKYKKSPLLLDEKEKKNYTNLLFKIFREYSSKKVHESFLLEKDCIEEEEYLNLFSLYKKLIDDYIENGLYENEKKVHIICGNGEIDWDKTINEFDCDLNKYSNPIYLDYYTHDIEEEQENYIKTIQKYLLTKAGEYLEKFKEIGLDEFSFDFHFDGEALGDIEHQLHKINFELREVFSERKITILKLMSLILKEQKHSGYEGLNLYGTKSYHSVWENICQNVLKNNNDLRGKIPKPKWIDINGISTSISTLVPDIVLKKENKLFILDAKYYNTEFDKNGILNNKAPGIGDVSKQFLYEKSYEIYYKNQEIKIYNVFLFPTEEEESKLIGEVKFELFPDRSIKLLKLPVKEMYNLYLKNLNKDIEVIFNNIK